MNIEADVDEPGKMNTIPDTSIANQDVLSKYQEAARICQSTLIAVADMVDLTMIEYK